MALTMETREFAGQNTTRLLGRLAFQMNHTIKSPDPEAVHDLRVAIRRFTQTLSVFKPCFPGKETRKLRRRLKKLMLLAGAVRNFDIALKLIAKSRSSDAAKLLPHIQTQRKESERILIGALKRRMERKSSLKWRNALEAALANEQDSACRIAIADTAQHVLPRMAKDFLERGTAASQSKASPEKLHQFRIASKKFRYTLELLAPLYGTALNPAIDSIKRAQTLLGDINDCVTVEQIVSAHKVGGALASWLKRRQRRKVEEFCRRWPEEFGNRDLVLESTRGVRKPAGSRTTNRKSRAVA